MEKLHQASLYTYMTKLLITGGCSNTAQTGVKNYEKYGVFTWPTLVSEKLDIDLLNVAVAGGSNGQIENRIFDAIMENRDKDIIVMVYWTNPTRINVFDYDTIIDYEFRSIHGTYIIDQTIRSIRRTKLLCSHFNIPCYQRISLGIETSMKNASNKFVGVAEYINSHPHIKEIDIGFPELAWGRWSTHNIMMTDYALPCGHPNQQAHEFIAEMFIDTVNGKKMSSRLDFKPETEFIYD